MSNLIRSKVVDGVFGYEALTQQGLRFFSMAEYGGTLKALEAAKEATVCEVATPQIPKWEDFRTVAPFLWSNTERLMLPLGEGVLTFTPGWGIVTAGNYVHWQCLGALAIAAHRFHLGLAVADHDLMAWQRDELSRVGVRWIDHQKPGLDSALTNERIICDVRAWWKPWVCMASPFERSLWIDADAVLIADPVDVFSTWKPLISTQRLWQDQGYKLYEKLVSKIFGKVHVAHRQAVADINTGVVAWTKGEPWISEWAAWCLRLSSDSALIPLCNVRDQSGAAISLLARLESNRPLIGLLDSSWNVPAEGVNYRRSRAERLPVPVNPQAFLETVTERHVGAKVVHWLGLPKPWQLAQP